MTTNVISDTLTISDSLKGSPSGTLRDTLHFTETLIASPCGVLRDTLTISDRMTPFETGVARDTLHVSDSMKANNGPGRARDSLTIRDSMPAAAIVNVVADSLTISDAVHQLIAGDVARDHLHISDSMAQHAGIARLVDSLHISDRLSAQVSAILADSLTISDRMRLTGAVDRISDSLTISDALVAVFHSFDVARDTLHISDAMTHRASISNVARDFLFISDDLGREVGNGGAWAAATDGYAMSRYVLPRIIAVGIVDDHVLVTAEDGIYVFEGDDDAGVDIDMHAETGLMQVSVPEARDINAKDTGDPRIKAASYVSMAYSGGRLRFGIGITRSGVSEQRYWYPFPDRAADVPTTTRVKIGRGAKSGFWRFLLENVEGDGFMVKEQRVLLEPLSRRI